jgi:WD40 repeat protein
VVLYQLVVGDLHRPLTTDWTQVVTDSLLREDLKACFAGEPQERLSGASQLAGRLRAWPTRRAEQARSQELESRRRRRQLATRFGALLLCVAAIAVVALAYGLDRAKQQALEARMNLYAADMSLVPQAVQRGDLGRARALLDRHRPRPGQMDLRGWEWRHYWLLTRSDALADIGHHEHCITALAFPSAGKTLYSTCEDDTVRAWDWATRKEIGRYLRRPEARGLTVSKDEKLLITGHADGAILFRDLPAGNTVAVITNASPVFALRLSPDEHWLAVGGETNVALVEMPARRVVTNWPAFTASVGMGGLAVSHDGGLLAYQPHQGAISLVDLRTLKQVRTLPLSPPLDQMAIAMQFSPQDRNLLVGGESGRITFWRTDDWEFSRVLTNHTAWVSALAFSDDGSRWISASADHSIGVWATDTWRFQRKLRGHLDLVWAAGFIPNTSMLASGGSDRTLLLWDLDQETPQAREVVPRTDSRTVDPDPNILASFNGGELTARYSPDGTITIVSRRLRFSFASSQRSRPGLVDFSPDGRALLLCDERRLEIWDVVRGEKAGETMLPWSPRKHRWSDGGRQMTLTNNREVEIWRRHPLRKVVSLPEEVWDNADLAASVDGSLVATANWDGYVRLYSIPSGAKLAELRGAKDSAVSVAFSVDQSRLCAVHANDPTVVLWDITRTPPQEVFRVPGDELPGPRTPGHRMSQFSETNLSVGILNQGYVFSSYFDLRAPTFAEIEAAERERASLGIQAAAE